LRPGPILRTYGTILQERVFYTYATAGALSFAGLFTYVAGSPIIFMDVFAVSPQVYGGIFALLATGFIGGSQFNIRLSKKYKSAQIFRAAIFSQSVWATLFLIATLTGVVNIYIAIGCLFMTMASVGTSYPNAAALALAPFDRNAGSAAGLLGVVQICGGAGASSLIGIINADTLLPVVAILAVTAWGAAAVLLAGGRFIAPASAVAGGESL
jgi:DHA1 family bicyclomycin/chloramphenicol resistance-like MFS transporter